MESGPQFRQRFEGGVAPRPFVDRICHLSCLRSRAFAVRRVEQCRRDGNNFLGETAAIDGGQGALMAAQRERVLFFA